MTKKKKPKRESIPMLFDGKRMTIVKYDFLPPNTVALSTELFNELKKGDK